MNAERICESEGPTYLIQIDGGPTFDVEETLRPTLQLLSRRFEGESWSCGRDEVDMEIDRMRLRVVQNVSSNPIRNYLNYRNRVLSHARKLHLPARTRIVVTSYDPFKSGLLAWQVSRLLGGVFVCEVNGQYGNPDNFVNLKSALWKRARLLQMRILGSFVVKRADGLRLLFDGQLGGFASAQPNAVVRKFFALTFTERFVAAPEEPFVLCAGFPFELKGVDLLIDAFIRLAPKYPDWKLVVIGHRIPESARARGLVHPQIETLPNMTPLELVPWMSKCAIFAMPSRSEGMGRVFIEAAASGKPRLATRVGGIPTVIEDGYDGLLVEKNDLEGLTLALDRLMSDAPLRHKMGQAAKERAEREFSPARYLSLFEELVTATLCRSS